MKTYRSMAIFLSLFMFVSRPLWPAETQNLLIDGDFEKGVAGWAEDDALKQFGVFRVMPDEARSGSVAMMENRSEDKVVAACQTIPVAQGKVYELSGFSRSTKLQEGAGIAIHALDADGKIIQRRWLLQIPSWGNLSWQEFSGRYDPPKGADRLSVRLSVYKRGTVWFDDLRLIARDRPRKESPWGKKLEQTGLSVVRHAVKRPVFHLEVADLDKDGQPEFLIGDIDGMLRCRRVDGSILWERDLGGLALDIDCGDIDGDGRPNVVVCSADVEGRVRVFGPTGDRGWTYSIPGAVFGHVAVADLDADGRCEVFATHGNEIVAFSGEGKVLWTRNFGGPRMRAVAVGDVTGDGQPNVVVSLQAQSMFMAALDRKGEPQWVFKPVGVGSLPGEDLCIADLDGDGRNEVVMASEQGKVVCVQDGKLKWLSARERPKLWPKHRDATANLGSARVEIVVGDFCPEREGLETLAALVDTAWLLDKDGKFIWETDSGLLLLDLLMGPDRGIYIPSSGFRDFSLYKLAFVKDEGNPLADYRIASPIYDELEKMYRQAVDHKPVAAKEEGKFHVIFANLSWPFGGYGSLDRLREAHEFLKTKENDRLEFIFMLWPKDLPVELHRGQMVEQEQVLQVVRFLEEIGRPFLFFVDHGCAPNLSLDSIEKTLQLAPNTCRGFYVAENTANYPNKKWDEFVDWAMKVMDLCRAHGGKKMIFKEMYDSWCALPADPRVRETLLQPKYRDIIVAMYATNNPHAPELQIGGMIGLKQSGMASEWGISTQYWNWSWAAHGLGVEYANICPADVIMRMELSAACLGARWFHIEGGQEYLVRGEGTLDPRAERHRDLVYELMRKGLLPPMPDADNLSFSRFVVARSHHPLVDEARKEERRLGSFPRRTVDALNSGLLGVGEAVQSVPPEYLPSYAYGVRRFCDSMFPAAPFGWLRFVPDCSDVKPFLSDKDVIRTDGCEVFLDGRRVAATEARPLLLRRLEKDAEALPFHADGASLYVHHVGDAWRVWLLDPGYMCPVGLKTSVEIRVKGPQFQAADLLTDQSLPCAGNRVAVEVPPGTFRVLEVGRAGH